MFHPRPGRPGSRSAARANERRTPPLIFLICGIRVSYIVGGHSATPRLLREMRKIARFQMTQVIDKILSACCRVKRYLLAEGGIAGNGLKLGDNTADGRQVRDPLAYYRIICFGKR